MPRSSNVSRSAFDELKRDKDADSFRPDEEWPKLFDDDVLARFHWPTDDERAERIEDLKHRPIRITPTDTRSVSNGTSSP